MNEMRDTLELWQCNNGINLSTGSTPVGQLVVNKSDLVQDFQMELNENLNIVYMNCFDGNKYVWVHEWPTTTAWNPVKCLFLSIKFC